jgi:hypothetical protein
MDPLTIALAIYGGYQGYRSSKKANANTLGQLFATAAGAYGGYNLGSGINSLASAGTAAAENIGQTAVAEGVTKGIGAFNPYAGAVDQFAGTTLSNAVDPTLTNALGTYNNLAPTGITAYSPQFQQLEPTLSNAAYNVQDGGALTYSDIPGEQTWSYTNPQIQQASYNGAVPSMDDVNRRQAISDKLLLDQERAQAELYRYDPSKTAAQLAKSPAERGVMAPGDYSQLETFGQRIDPNKNPKSFTDTILGYTKKTFTDSKTGGLDLGKAALVGVPTALYASGAFEREPYQRSMFTYNVNYPDLYRNRKFYTQDPESGEVRELAQQDYIPEEKAREGITADQQFGPYRRETLTLREGGLASLAHFKDGGVTYLPSKAYADEDNEDSYMRANGYVEDSTGSGDKDEDTMLAQLADGEFVTRTDGVLGAGILAGANPSDPKQMRKMGADFFYEQQKRFKRIFDLLDASRKATAH